MIKEIDEKIKTIDAEIAALSASPKAHLRSVRIKQLGRTKNELLALLTDLSPSDKVFLARHPGRPNIVDYIDALFTDFFEQKGDRSHSEDASILGGIAFFGDTPVTVIGHRKGKNIDENVKCRFGMPGPEGYRKALRLMKQAEKFRRPVITFIDTPGAYPGIEAEAGGQGEAIASCLACMSGLRVPTVAVVTGEGGSGGALALGVADRVLMLENAVYSILSPEGFASILWKDSSKSDRACELMKLTANDLSGLGVIDGIISEPPGGAHRDHSRVFKKVREAINLNLTELKDFSSEELTESRYKKFRKIGNPLSVEEI